MSLKRIVTGLCVAIFWVVALQFLPLVALFAVLIGAQFICLYEFGNMIKKANYDFPLLSIFGAGVIWQSYCYCAPSSPLGAQADLVLLATLVFALLMRVMLDNRIKKPLETSAISVLSFVYIPFFLSYLLRITQLSTGSALVTSLKELFHISTPANIAGMTMILFIVAVVKMSDAGGYFIGSAFGKHKLIPRLSPGKSWEGLYGGLVFSLLTAGGFYWAGQHYDLAAFSLIRAFSLPQILSLSVVLVIVGLLGDLFESLCKRATGVKDSSALFPAMGGFLDTFDSLIFTPAIVYYFLLWIR